MFLCVFFFFFNIDEDFVLLKGKKKIFFLKFLVVLFGFYFCDFVRCENIVFFFKWVLNCWCLIMLRGYERVLEWKFFFVEEGIEDLEEWIENCFFIFYWFNSKREVFKFCWNIWICMNIYLNIFECIEKVRVCFFFFF